MNNMADDGSVSYILKRLFDSLGLNEEQRQKRMTYQTINQLLTSTSDNPIPSSFTLLKSGSSFEATTIHGLSSDVDIMVIDNRSRVITDIKDWRCDGVPSYLMDSTGCYRAFVKLYRLSSHYPGLVYADSVLSLTHHYEVNEDGAILLRNSIGPMMLVNVGKLNVDGNVLKDIGIPAELPILSKGEVHGPALTIPESESQIETDHVYSLRCDSFPSEAANWKQRQTPLTRTKIDPAIIDDINHCYLVGVGDKNSPTENLEWRLSFSHIENKLVHAWNNVQYQCYVLMKFIKNDLIKPFVPDVLCSYHFKTLMMWMNEEYPKEFFISSHFEHCTLVCLTNLATSVNNKCLPHYFVEGCNLLYPKLTNNIDIARKLLVVIENIISTWPRCLFNISGCNLGRMFYNCLARPLSLSSICTNVLERRRYEGYLFELLYEQHTVCHKYFDVRDALIRKSTDSFYVFNELCHMSNQPVYNDEGKQFINFAVKDILCNFGLEQIQCNISVSNKTSLRNNTSGLRYIQRYRNSCCIDTGLKIAAHYVMKGNYRQSSTFLDRVEDQIKKYTCYSCRHITCDARFSENHRVNTFDNKPTMTEFCKHFVGRTVTYRSQNTLNMPKGVVYEVFRLTSVSHVTDPSLYYWHSEAIIHCPVYMYYLRFISYQMQGQDAHQQVALNNIEWAANEVSKYTRSHLETNHNIIGHCHRSTGNTTRAYKEYRKSLETEKYNNAVLWHLAVLLRSEIRGEH